MARLLTYEATKLGYAALWAKAAVRPEHAAAAKSWAQKIGDATHRPHFDAVEKATEVPWFVVGLILMRESSLDLNTFLGNGQALSRRTTVVPIGMGPFTGPTAFQDGAVASLKHEGMVGLTGWHEVAFCLYWMERDNGQGYFGHGINSPYLWSWTTLYTAGKFVSDGKFSASAVDPQPGCAAVLKALIEINPDVSAFFQQQETKPVAPTTPTTATPAGGLAGLAADPVIGTLLQNVLPSLVPFLLQGVAPKLAGALPPPWNLVVSAAVPLIQDAIDAAQGKTGSDLIAHIGQHGQGLFQTIEQIGKQAQGGAS